MRPALSVVRIVLLVSDCAHTTSPQRTDPRIYPCSVLVHRSSSAISTCNFATLINLVGIIPGPPHHQAHCNAQGRLAFRGLVLHRWCASFIPSVHPDSTHSPSSSSAAHRIINGSPPRLLCDPFPIVPSLTQADPPRPDCICGEFIVRVSCARPPAALGLSHVPRFPVARSSSSTRA